MFSKATASQVKRASGATILNGNTKKIKEQSLQDDTELAIVVRGLLEGVVWTTFHLLLIPATTCTVVLLFSFTAAVHKETHRKGVLSPPKR